jgi:hypothetical protein
MSKLYTVAGSSVQDGVFKLRFANTMDRVNVLTRAGHSSVQLYTLPYAMSKEDATLWLENVKQIRALADSNQSLMERVVKDVKRVPRKGTDEEQVNAQFAIWRERAKKKFDFLVD